MKIPKRLQPLVDEGLIDDVLGQLMSGKEATVYMVRRGDEICCAKVYKEASQRSFKQAVQYQEGRKVRNTRRARAMEKGSKFGRQQQEESWQHTEVDALYKLAAAGVRVPTPYGCYDGVLLMELITDEAGLVAPRLNDVSFTEAEALSHHRIIMDYIKLMLCEGLVHGDLSEFNVLIDDKGPVIIDLPQVIDAAANNNAKRMFGRDVTNMTEYYAQFAPQLSDTAYAKEMWHLYETSALTPQSELTGLFDEVLVDADVDSVMEEINAAFAEHEQHKAWVKAQSKGQDKQEDEDPSEAWYN
ncbi:protein of unknown function RIO1 [Shewanella denitrificans OS217]|jgi:RIO kinase 1|uniref:non-specific serine/threonine protein kinase n=1 Tax=Shewanella denitrificans (strain OS217 / ATCC BAA-1090 / DSM 15013) TaxID=318161 RepID=Q12NN8_SHEDO|nr:PA4780 family RIO1-like protein kinase [Shewanella denitrificans]ABE54938.1 protein of unknown function RIO1 [Shewanella denitrificans OS217]